MSKTSDKDPVRFSTPYEHETTDVALDPDAVEELRERTYNAVQRAWSAPSTMGGETKLPQIDPRITPEEVRYLVAHINDLEAQNKKLEKRAQASMLALESLTCGGSEYVGDVDRCVEYIRRGQESMRRGFGKKIEIEGERANRAEAKNKKLDDERIEAVLQASDAQQRVGQLENDLAEYQDKPEAFKRLRELLRKERQMRKQESKRFFEVCDERNAAQAELEKVRREIIHLESWSLFEAGCVPDSIQDARWWTWDCEDPKYYHALAVIRWGNKIAEKLFPVKEAVNS